MPSHGSAGALGLGSQPSCSSPLPRQRNPFPALQLLSPGGCSSALLSQDSFLDSFSGSFCDRSEDVGSEPWGCGSSVPDPQLIRRIVSQVEFYLSDENLAKDAFLLKHVQKNKMGFVSIKLLTSFKKVKYLTRDWRLTLYALRFSELLEVNKEGTKVRRRVPIPESLLSIPPSKLLLAWELLPQERLPLLQRSFLETITRLFSPFGAIASIRMLRPGRRLPADVRRYAARFPELLRRCCALVEYESLESACRAFEDLGQQSQAGGRGIRVVRLCGKGSKKKAGAERELPEELLEQPAWKAPAAVVAFPYGPGDSSCCGSLECHGAPASLPLPLHKEPPAWPGGGLGGAVAGSLLPGGAFAPLGPGTRSPRGCGWGSGAWGPWHGGSSLDAKPPPGSPWAEKRGPEPLGLQDGLLPPPRASDGTEGFCSTFGRGELVLQH
ncbi:la-related protein 6-like [Colius striatus]|uniref:la-related protein 6-like n=1 Tax=Colius striatus TaxID=57412 RepID=UPI002B1CF65C|nr:la-related protein 6-like [Colius striatus]